ncbi:hypothetical protein FR943_19740 [Mycobacterium sp. TNTM28]|uniref:Uncharacterized protein n=1 Tax=[Mycobacterium] fortunisiensis TaxID=2600579 RepID=A0ABS6KR16_9MYCO|nr:hypothetical protein [[Mycobacterium] fortunisiensis]
MNHSFTDRDGNAMLIRLIATLMFVAATGLTSACTAAADPPTPGPAVPGKPLAAGDFPDMSSFTAANPEDYAVHYETPGRPNAAATAYNFTTPDGIRCSFDRSSAAGCTGNNLPALTPLECDPAKRMYGVNAISTGRNVWQTSDTSCDKPPTGKELPPFHTLTVYGVTCGVDDKGTTACKDPQGRGFVLSPSWSGWIPKV